MQVKSSGESVTSGVHQGSELGAVLFNIWTRESSAPSVWLGVDLLEGRRFCRGVWAEASGVKVNTAKP